MKKTLLSLTNFYKKYKFQILLVLGLRIAFSVWLALIWIVIDKHIPTSEGVLRETYSNLERSSSLLGRAFIDVWLRWDAVHYMNIAEFGYKGVGIGDTVFFPLYPYLVSVISKFTAINVTLVGILTSSITTMIALIFLYELVIELFNNEELAKLSSLCLALYPTSFFLHAPYTDALFLSLSIGSILMMVRKRPLIAGLLVFFAGITRAQGVLLTIPMAMYFFQDVRKENSFLNLRKILGLIISPIGFGIFSLWRVRSGISGFFSTYQTHSATGFKFPLVNIYYAILELFKNPTILEFSEFLSVFVFLVVLVWMFFQPNFRKHLPIMIYNMSVWLMISSKTVFYASTLQSANRYVLHIFFAFVGFAYLFINISTQKQKILIFLSSAAFMTLSGLYALWIFIG